jgi:lipopolysaccharide export system protein LptA
MHRQIVRQSAGTLHRTSLLVLWCLSLQAQVAKPQLFSGSQSTVYYDADEINLDKDTGNLKAKGNAFVLLGNIFISADSFEYRKTNKIIIAEGGVRLVRNRERIGASRIVINEETNEARMDDVEIFADPKDSEARINEEVLGFSSAEIAFEVARQERSREIILELTEIRSRFPNLRRRNSPAAKQAEERKLIARYSQLLERLIRTRYQPSDALRDLPPDARTRIENRREAVRTFATKDPELAKKIAGLQRVPGYLSMKAHRLFQNSNQHMDVENASLTTCRCSPDENPAWGLSASRAFVEPNEYITLYGTTLEVARFPLAYSPWFKMPIKTKRQSGFLLPAFYLSRSGDAATFPYFLTLGEHADSTLTFTYFSARGPRLEAESRYYLSDESKTIVHGEILRQKADPRISSSIEPNYRWAWNAQSNLPVARRTSVKFDFERLSDQRYFSDLTKEPGTTQDLFTPQIIVERFLHQSAALEHSAEAFALTAQLQKPIDVFNENPKNLPSRSPRIDFSIHPRSIGETGLAWEGRTAYENIVQEEPFNSSPIRMGLAGNRRTAKLRTQYTPLPSRFLNFRLAGELGHVRYNTKSFKGELNYGQAEIATDIPFYANVYRSRSSDSAETLFRHNFTPFASVRWIPEVRRSDKYPDIYSTFYAADNIARAQLLEFGFNTDILITKDEFKSAERPDVQNTATGAQPSAPANENMLFAVLQTTPPAAPHERSQFLFGMTTQKRSQEVFQKWAETEIEQFMEEIKAAEKGADIRFVTVQAKSWRRSTTESARPVGFSIRSSYNFEAVRTAQEQNRNLQPGQTPVSPAPWGEINGSLGLSAHPLVPVAGSLTRIWQPAWGRFREEHASIEVSAPFGFSTGFSRSTVRSEAVDASGNKTFPQENLWGVDSTYQPKPWLKFQAQYRRNVKPQPAPAPEFEYSALQKITLLGFQDCVDITLQRYKDREVRERLATWTLGLNLIFLGQQRQVDSLGRVVDRAIKSQLNRKQNSIPR